jgi:hypothetical protein
MSVSMTWQPYKPKTGKHFDGGSNLHGILERTYGSFPIILTGEDVKTLEGIKACGHDGVRDLINALYDYEKIKVEAQL